MSARVVSLLVLSVLVLVPATPAVAVPGALDPTFSNDGLLELEFGELEDPGHPAVSVSMAPIGSDSSGKIVLAGTTMYRGTCYGHLGCSTNPVATIVRVNPDGSLDPTFSGDGKLEATFGAGQQPYEAVSGWALQPDGRILAADAFAPSIRIARLDNDASLDPTFAAGSWTNVPLPQGLSSITNTLIAVQGNGKVVAAGIASGPSCCSDDLVMVRVNADGTQDLSFGEQGYRLVHVTGSSYPRLADLEVDSADRIYLSAGTAAAVPGDFNALAHYLRFGPDGAPDEGFGTQGSTEVDIPNVALTGPGTMAVTDAGEIYGLLPNPPPPTSSGLDPDDYNRVSVVRLDGAGQPDPSYGPNGVRPVDDRPTGVSIGGLDVTPDSKLLLAGTSGSRLLLSRRLAGGSADPVFGPGGWSQSATSTNNLLAAVPLALADGRAVVTATVFAERGGACIVAARYQQDGEPSGTAVPDPVPCVGACKPIHGCPFYGRDLTIHVRPHRVFSGRLSSSRAECVAGATIEVLRVRHGMYGSATIDDSASTSGRYEVRLPRAVHRGRFYARVRETVDTTVGTCVSTRSATIPYPTGHSHTGVGPAGG